MSTYSVMTNIGSVWFTYDEMTGDAFVSGDDEGFNALDLDDACDVIRARFAA